MAVFLVLFGVSLGGFALGAQPEGGTASHVRELYIFGINDFHGNLEAKKRKLEGDDGAPAVDALQGGFTGVDAYVRAARAAVGADHMLLLDAGDEWQGTLESNVAEGEPIVDFFGRIGVDAAAVGNHEFDFGAEGPAETDANGPPLGNLLARMSQARFPFLSANLYEKASGKLLAHENLKAGTLIERGGVKVGIVGATTEETPVSTRRQFVDHLDFTRMRERTVAEAVRLRKAGADLVILLAHAGTKCAPAVKGENLEAVRTHRVTDAQGKCGDDEEMTQLLKQVPTGTFDLVVGGHRHMIVHHWINGTPVAIAGKYGQHFNFIRVRVDSNAAPKAEVEIQGPIPFCSHVFERTQTCDPKATPKGARGRVVPAQMLGRPIMASTEEVGILKKIIERTEAIKRIVMGEALEPIPHFRDQDSPLSNFFADSIRESVGADIGVNNSHGVRVNEWEKGPITYGTIFAAAPFDNFVSLVTMTGRELMDFLRVANYGGNDYFHVSGLRLELQSMELKPLRFTDLDGDGKHAPWEADRLVSARMTDGSPIDPDRLYRVAMPDFVAQGGDDVEWAMKRIPKDRVTMIAGPFMRDTIMDRVRRIGRLTVPVEPNPRIQVRRIESATP